MKKSSLNSALLAVVACFSLSVPRAQADIAMTAQEVGPDVVFSYSGAIDLTLLGASADNTGPKGMVYPQNSYVAFGAGVPAAIPTKYFSTGILAPDIGPGPGPTIANSFTGTTFAIGNILTVPRNYASGSQISGSMTFLGNTIEGLGLTRSTEPYTWILSGGQKITLSFLDPTVGTAKLKKDLKKLTAKFKKAKARNQAARVKAFKKKIKALKKQLRALT